MKKSDIYFLIGFMLFMTLCWIAFAGINDFLDYDHFWHIIMGILLLNGFIGLVCGCLVSSELQNEEDKKLGRRWVWDKFDVCDPDLCEGHYEYDSNYHIKYK